MTHLRPDFRPGIAVLLADGREWVLPSPDDSRPAGPACLALLAGVVEADDSHELLRAELALGLHLIEANYDLPPTTLGTLFEFPPADPNLARLQADLHRVALEYVRVSLADPGLAAQTKPTRRPGLIGRLRASLTG